MGQRRGGHLKTRADPTFTTIFIDDFYPSFPPSDDDDDDGDRISKGDNLKRNGTRPAPFERRAPTAEYRTRERTLAYISIPFTAPRRLGTALLALPIAIHRDSVSFSFFDRRSRRSRRRRRRSTRSNNYNRVYLRRFSRFFSFFLSSSRFTRDAEATRRRLVRGFLSPEEPLNGTKS